MNEHQIRFLRDQVYGKPTTDANWEACRHKWMEPNEMDWLVDTSHYFEIELASPSQTRPGNEVR